MSSLTAGTHPLDRPVWNCLNGPQQALALGSGVALRIDPAYGPFAAARDCGLPAQAALAGLLGDDDEIWIVEQAAIVPPPGTCVVRVAELVQMVALRPNLPERPDPEIIELAERHVPEMRALVAATAPGPWRPATHRYGQFFGIVRDGRLVAMAGERMRPGVGWAELSGVCTAPEARGQGMAARLIGHVIANFAARGDTAFLHSYAANLAANRLYESLGFRTRATMVATVLAKV